MSRNNLIAHITNRVFYGVVIVAIICGGVGCFDVAAAAYVKLHDDSDVVKIVTTVINAAIFFATPLWLSRRADRMHREFIEDYAARLNRIEETLDKRRVSSGLNTDGTDPAIGPVP